MEKVRIDLVLPDGSKERLRTLAKETQPTPLNIKQLASQMIAEAIDREEKRRV